MNITDNPVLTRNEAETEAFAAALAACLGSVSHIKGEIPSGSLLPFLHLIHEVLQCLCMVCSKRQFSQGCCV